jgi:hypothetical protein
MSNIERANPSTGEIVRTDGAGGTSIERAAETAKAAMIAQATAEIQAMYVVARQNPRSWDDVRVRLLKDCARPGFAKSAIYGKPQRMQNQGERKDLKIGDYYDGILEGLSIRFAEDCQRIAGNLRAGSIVLYDDPDKRLVQFAVVELESNARVDQTITITKTIERRSATGRIVVDERINGSGQVVYLLEATEDELRNKENAAISRVKRNLLLAMIPADIREECEAKAKETRAAEIKRDPDAERKKLADAFTELGIMPTDIEAYLGHGLAQCSPAQLGELRALYVGVKEGAATWAELLEERTKEPKEQPKTTKARKLAEDMRARKAAAKKDEKPADGAAKASETKPEPKDAAAPVQGAKNTHRGEATDGEPPADVATTGDK